MRQVSFSAARFSAVFSRPVWAQRRSTSFPASGSEMGIVVLDGSSVRRFVEDEEAFKRAVDPQFEQLDADKDGVLSTSELRVALERLNLLETMGGFPVKQTPEQLNTLYNQAFEMFDLDHDGGVDLAEFREQLRRILLAIADGLGVAPVQMMVDDDSLLHGVVEHEEQEAQDKKPVGHEKAAV